MSTSLISRAVTRLSEPPSPRPRAPRVFELSFSAVGLVVGLYLFAISLTPSLLPRSGVVQGLGSGVAFMIGYGLGAAAYAIMRFLHVPRAHGRVRALLLTAALALIAFQAWLATWRYVGWQNETRLAFEMEPLSPLVWPQILIVAAAVAALVLVISRSLRLLFRKVGTLLDRWLPRPLAVALAAVILVSLMWWVASGAFVNAFFSTSNWIFSAQDLRDNPGVTQPLEPEYSGSPESLVDFENMGRQGRSFVSTGPTAADINEYSGGGALEPIRAYVGLRSADTLEQRAELALAELQRAGAFEREILVVSTVTGTGYLDPAGVDPLEYLWNGDTAIVGVQYSYLPSWISLLADQEIVQETSREVFRTVHDYWSTLPENDRPRLYLYGLSLGSTGVEAVLSSVDILNEPIDGALMTGPPFVNEMHADIVASRDEGTPPWQPVFSDGRTVRFTAEQYGLDHGGASWGPTRVVYLQHGSDPVTWFNGRLALDSPEWLEPGQRAPDVAATMEWYPIVTMWQVLLDMPGAGAVPEGYGHLYTHRANLDAWAGITQPDGWTETAAEELGVHLEERAERLDVERSLLAD